MIGKPLSEAQAIIAQYDSRLPFVCPLSRIVQDEAVERRLHGALRRRAPALGPLRSGLVVYAKGAGPCSYEEAVRRRLDPEHPWFYQTLQRHGTYTALNAQIQGNSARHTKLWMRACWREGIIPLLQMHDCLDCSVTSREQGELIARLGCEAVQLEVPMKVDVKFGNSWGDAKHTWDELKPEAAVKMTAAETIAKALGGRRTGSGWTARCPLHDDQKPSLSISSGKNGKVLVHCHAGCNQRDVYIAVLRKRGLLGRHKRKDHVADKGDADADARKRSEMALAIWRASQPAEATLVETYLAARGIELPLPDALRFHAGLKHPVGRQLAGDGGAGDERRGRNAAGNPPHLPCPRWQQQSSGRPAEDDAWALPWWSCAPWRPPWRGRCRRCGRGSLRAPSCKELYRQRADGRRRHRDLPRRHAGDRPSDLGCAVDIGTQGARSSRRRARRDRARRWRCRWRGGRARLRLALEARKAGACASPARRREWISTTCWWRERDNDR